MDAFRQKKTKKVEYKEYTLDDWKRLKNQEVKLGGLGPDLDNETQREKVIFLL